MSHNQTDIALTGLTNETAYQVRVAAANRSGLGAWSDTVTGVPTPQKPDPPTGFTVARKDRAVDVSWTAAVSNGSAITDYDVQYRKCTATDGDTAVLTCATNPTWGSWTDRSGETTSDTGTEVTVSNLTNGVAYEFHARAANSLGESDWGHRLATTPATTPTKPGQPTVTAQPRQLSVSWSKPADGGEAITDYDVRHCDQSTGCDAASEWTELDDTGQNGRNTATTATITGLTNGTTYRVQVRAGNAVGDSDWSSYRTGKPVDKPATPGAPTLVSGAGSLAVRWTAPADNGSAITGYKVRYCDTSDSSKDCSGGYDDWTTKNVTGTSTTVSSLTNGNSYEVEVQAKNAVGSSAWSGVTTGVPGGPAAPSKPTLTVGAQQLGVSWSAPADRGSAITGYDVYYCDNTDTANPCTDDSNWSTSDHSGTTRSTTITGLDNGTEYKVRVRAQNGRSWGGWSAGGRRHSRHHSRHSRRSHAGRPRARAWRCRGRRRPTPAGRPSPDTRCATATTAPVATQTRSGPPAPATA